MDLTGCLVDWEGLFAEFEVSLVVELVEVSDGVVGVVALVAGVVRRRQAWWHPYLIVVSHGALQPDDEERIVYFVLMA